MRVKPNDLSLNGLVKKETRHYETRIKNLMSTKRYLKSQEGNNMVKCPRCSKEVSNFEREWDYSVFHVKLFECDRCEKSFKAYYRAGKLSHTIPKSL